jgi:formylglycine-generating enzyme required for sulfatase activity
MQVISGPAKAHSREPKKLRYLLAPVVARSKAEQERFYHIFEQYYAEVLAAALEEEQTEAKFSWLKKVRTWLRRWWWALSTVLTLIALSFWLIKYLATLPKDPSINFTISDLPIHLGDTTTFTLDTRNIEIEEANILWRLMDKKSGQVDVEKRGVTSWQVPFKDPKNVEKIVSLEVYEKRRDTTFRIQGNLLIECYHPPQLEPFDLPTNLKPGQPFTFVATVLDETPDLQYHWDFGDGQTSTERSPRHSYLKEGSYKVELQVTRTDEPGHCTTRTIGAVRVGEDQVILPFYDLQYDPIRTRATFGWATWVLVILLGAGTFYGIFRWAKTQRPPAAIPPEAEQTQGLSLQSADRPPYEIPFRPLNGLIRNLTGQFRLADALRRRQEGLRQEVDVPKTLEVTIKGGGFPRLQLRSTTRPADYLFLVDEQNENSHQGRLLRHLVRVLHDQDVHAELFYYRKEFFHFWNPQFPQGITLEQISRLCPEHRLLVFGDAHALLDPYAQGQQALRSEAIADFQRWKQRLLLSPRPPQSWDFREASIHSLLPVFPSDLEGQMAAANFIDNGMAPEDLPVTFASWRERLATARSEPDVNRRWRSAEDHAAYLGGSDSDLYRWFSALALYPTPTWEITLAIGAALDIPLHADNLLILARIPSLQEGKISPRLRKELLDSIDQADETTVREAIAQELEASLVEAAPGFANRAVQGNLAVQKFALAPYDPATQNQVQALLNQGWFNRLQIEDMGSVAARELAPRFRPITKKGNIAQQSNMTESPDESVYFNENVAQQSNIPNFNRPTPPLPADEPTLRRFLSERGEQAQQEIPAVEKPPKAKTINREFWQMVACAVATLALVFTMMILDSTPRLYRWVFGTYKNERVYGPQLKMRGNLLVKEAMYFADSAVILNNQAVQVYREQAFAELQNMSSANTPRTYARIPEVRNLLARAMQANEQRYSAGLNLARLNYNIGVGIYLNNQNGNNLQMPDSLAINSFDALRGMSFYFGFKSVPESDKMAYEKLFLAATHGHGVISFLSNVNKYSAETEKIHQDLLEAGFYDTTQVRPNLSTLLKQEPSRIISIKPLSEAPEYLEVQVNYYTNPQRDPSLRLRLLALQSAFQSQGRAGSTPTSFVPRQEIQAQSREATASMLLQINSNRPSDSRRTDSLRVELLRINPNPRANNVVARLTIPYRKTWGTAAAEPPDEAEISLLTGQIVEESRSLRPNPVSKATLTLDWNVGNEIRTTRQLSDERGRYTLRRDLTRISGLTIKVTKEGYQPDEQSFTRAQLQQLPNGRLPDFRLLPAEEQHLNPQQQRQNNERTEYRPVLREMIQIRGPRIVATGCLEDGRDKNCEPDELPARIDTLNTYWIGKYEVTNEEYAVFLNDLVRNQPLEGSPADYVRVEDWGLQKSIQNGQEQWAPQEGYEKFPVIAVNWNGAIAYCKWLSQKTGQKYRLPTEAEWENAARAKGEFQYAGNNTANEVAWFSENSKTTHAVGQKRPNQLQIYDLSGNVWEWCQDWYGPYTTGGEDYSGPRTGTQRVIRGGSWYSSSRDIRVARRYSFNPNSRNNYIGFRLARTP